MDRLTESLSDLGFFELNLAGEVRGWSDAAARLLGFLSDEVVGRPATQFTCPAVEPAAVTALQKAAREGRSETFVWAIRKDGSRFWANEVTHLLRNGSGDATGFARVLRHATAWQAAEEQRDRIFTLSADLICVAGFDGFFKRVNPSFTRVLGHTQAELLAKPFLDFVHCEDVAATQREMGKLTAGGHEAARAFQNRYRRSDGTYCWLEWKSSSVVEDRLIYAVARDVTEQKAIEQKLQEYSKELERSNAELQQFAYVASHDLQEPLRAVAGCVQMVAESNAGRMDKRSDELMSLAVDGAIRMQTLIEDLLAFSRVGSKGISKAWVDPGSAVHSAMRRLQAAISESDAQITVDPLPRAWADSAQLAQLFQNLLGNAIKFQATGRPQITVQAQIRDGEIVFSVRDNGIGIAPEYHERIFGLFQRLHRRKSYSGTGIGLAICKKIVERHGGRIWVESRDGGGANFQFTIPNETRK